ncbi:MAG: tRNA 2-thiouridine(34) synthase MnmA [Bacteroidetes bacterium]|nr:tRNA 2-thiouridine(34) synthase MnmA [Bacteroidota bacterium]
MSSKGRVLVAMSGGIDSSVTAALLHREGYEVIGITMKTWDYAASGGGKKETGCCSLDSINDARQMAVEMGFPHYIIDIREEFGDYVINNFVDEYLAGRTPNPCVLCNTHIKWEALLRRADRMDCRYIATGHYARLREYDGQVVIARGADDHKDQSYVLWGLRQEVLKRTLFPVGGFQKPQIRQMAADWGFDSLAKKPDSYEICFVPDNDYRGFLRRRKPELAQLEGGRFHTTEGRVVGTHQGYPFYTIGQRKGLPAMGEPYYVVDILPQENVVIIGREEALFEHTLTVRGLNLLKYPVLPEEGLPVIAQIRYNDSGNPAMLYPGEVPGTARAIFDQPVKAITPGQSAVFYEDDEVVAGGWIQTVGLSPQTVPGLESAPLRLS